MTTDAATIAAQNAANPLRRCRAAAQDPITPCATDPLRDSQDR